MKGSALSEVMGNLFWIVIGLVVVTVIFVLGNQFIAKIIGIDISSTTVFHESSGEGYVCVTKGDKNCEECGLKPNGKCNYIQTVNFENILTANKYVDKIKIEVENSMDVDLSFFMVYDNKELEGEIKNNEIFEREFESIKIKSLIVTSSDNANDIEFLKITYWLSR